MKLLFNLKDNLTILITLISLAVLFLAAGLTLIYLFLIRRGSQKKTAKDLEKRYKRLHTLLVEDVEQFIARLEYISNQNLEYIQYHEKYVQMYQNILQENDRNSYVAISGLITTINEKNYRGINNLINSTKTIVIEFDHKVIELYNELNNLLQKDEEFHQEAIKLQRLYRELKEKYAIHEGELKIIKDSFDKFFGRIDQLFSECEELTSAARYEESNEKLPIIEKVLLALIESFDKIPVYCVRISRVIPKKMEEVKAKYDELEKNYYPLHHLKVMSKLDSHKNTLDEVYKKIASFDFNNVQEKLDGIDEDIMNIFKSFDEEIEAKNYFDQNSEKMYDDTYSLEKQYMKIKRILPSYKEVYLIKDRYLDKMIELEKDIDNVSHIKRDLDTFIHSTTKQPFSIIVLKMYDMEKEMARIKEIIKDFNQYLNSLKTDTEMVYTKICEYFLKLKDAQYVIREMNVPSFNDRLKISFDRSFSYLEDIGDIIKVQPIDVQNALDTLEYAEELILQLLKEVEENSAQRKYAEESIVYANQYRQGFLDCKYALNNAGTSFFESDFTRTIEETVAIIKKMRPDVNK